MAIPVSPESQGAIPSPTAKPGERFQRTLLQKIETAFWRALQDNPAHFQVAYQREEREHIRELIETIQSFKETTKADQQYIFAWLAKKFAYRDFAVLTDEERAALQIEVPLRGQRVTYRFDQTVDLGGLTHATILTAKGHPPLILVPGTVTSLDNPGKILRTLGANIQGTTWKAASDALLKNILSHLQHHPGEPSAFLVGHSAGAAAIRNLISRYKDKKLTSKAQEALMNASVHAFSPPATSPERARLINTMQRSSTSAGGFTTYIDIQDPVPHMAGTTHAGTVLVSAPDDRPMRKSHSYPPPITLDKQGHIITPYQPGHWQVNRKLSIGSLLTIGLVNFLGVATLLHVTLPIIKQAFFITMRLLTTLTLLAQALVMLKGPDTLEILQTSELGSHSLKLLATIAKIPYTFIKDYWNKAVASHLFSLTGQDYFLADPFYI